MGTTHHHPPPPRSSKPGDERYQAIRNITLVGSVVNLLLAIGKIMAGLFSHSAALIADGVHSLSDLITDLFVVVAAKHSSREADEAHPYGHGRFETLATVLIGVALMGVAFGIAWDSINRLFHPEALLTPGLWALVIAVLSIVAKELLYQYTVRVAKRVKSEMLKANAWHHRSDSISSVVVVIGVAGTMAGLEYLDAIAAVVVGVMVAKIGWDLVRRSVYELVDTALEPEQVEEIRREILAVGGVRELHMLRTRRSGGDVLVDVHVIVDPTLSVSEGHYIGEKVRKRLLDCIEEVADVTVHIDPEDDEKMGPSQKLPTRSQVRTQLEEVWGDNPLVAHIERINLHYLDGKLTVEIQLPASQWPNDADGQEHLAELGKHAEALDTVHSIEILMRK